MFVSSAVHPALSILSTPSTGRQPARGSALRIINSIVLTTKRLAFARTLMKKLGGCSRPAGAAFTS